MANITISDESAEEDAEMLSEDENEHPDPLNTDLAAENENQGPVDASETLLTEILQIMGLTSDAASSEPLEAVADLENEQFLQEKDDITRQCDQLFDIWKVDKLYQSALLSDTSDARLANDRFQWVTVGALCWVKHPKWDWWPGIIKRVTKARGAKSITQQAEASVIFLEPLYFSYLAYVRQAPNLRLTLVQSFTSMAPVDPFRVRPPDQVERSRHSWLTCGTYPNYTFFEISERMAVACERLQGRLVASGSGAARLDTDLLGGLFWLANAIWLKMNASGVDLPTRPDACKQWEPYLHLLDDVSYWRREMTDLSTSDRRNKRTETDENFEEEEEPDGCYGYDFIQVSVQRDPSLITYSEGSLDIVTQREKYGEELLAVIRSPKCRERLKSLRDSPVGSFDNTDRTRALKKKELSKLMYGSVVSPTGPIVVDSQVYSLYRFMRCLRLPQDKDNVRFLRACYDVWLPEALIYAIMVVKHVTQAEAEKEYAERPLFVPEEIEARWSEAPTLFLADVVHRNDT